MKFLKIYFFTGFNCELLSVLIQIIFYHVFTVIFPKRMEQYFASNAEHYVHAVPYSNHLDSNSEQHKKKYRFR